MQSVLTSVSNPVWANEQHTQIDCVITTSQFGSEQLPFTADQNDVEAHGKAIFSDIVSGKYGVIGDYVPPVDPRPTAPSGAIPVEIL